MDICAKHHRQIIFEGLQCPACSLVQLVGEKVAKIDELESGLQKRENLIEDLKQQLEELNERK